MSPETTSNKKLLTAKEEELYFLQQVFKNLKYLQHLYQTGKVKNADRSWYVEISINNVSTEISRVEKELKELKTNNNNE